MKTQFIILFIALTLWAGSLFAVELQSIEITGFGDFCTLRQQGDPAQLDFMIGQVEVDLETAMEENIVVGIAIAYDPEDAVFELGAFTIDSHLFGSNGSHFRTIDGFDHSGIIPDQFDVPFGIE